MKARKTQLGVPGIEPAEHSQRRLLWSFLVSHRTLLVIVDALLVVHVIVLGVFRFPRLFA